MIFQFSPNCLSFNPVDRLSHNATLFFPFDRRKPLYFAGLRIIFTIPKRRKTRIFSYLFRPLIRPSVTMTHKTPSRLKKKLIFLKKSKKK